MSSGFLLVNKPAGPTSNGVLSRIKKKLGIKKMGHLGTLDPFATGLLIVALGEATKYLPYLKADPKVYKAQVLLGTETDTGDATGIVKKQRAVPSLLKIDWNQLALSLTGTRPQIPPMYSAKKIEGVRLYDLARQGLERDRQPSMITVHEFQIFSVEGPVVHFQVSCSQGTYVRVLGVELAEKLGTLGHLISLERMACGNYFLKDAVAPETEDLSSYIIPIPTMLSSYRKIFVTEMEYQKLIKGQRVELMDSAKEEIILLFHDTFFMGLGQIKEGFLRPLRLLQNQS